MREEQQNSQDSKQPVAEASDQNNAAKENHKEQSSGYFRWQGLLGFVVCLGLMIAVLFVYAGPLIKTGIEKGGSWYWGAEVNVAEVDVVWSPFKLDVLGFQATDAKSPSHNLVAFDQASVSVDLFQAILGRTLVHELVIDKVQLNQTRKNPGKVTVVPEDDKSLTDSATSLFENSVQSLPNVDDLLKQADLKTVKAGLKLQETYKTEKAALEALKKQLPSKEKIKEYQAAIKKITDTKIKTPQQLAALTTQLNQLKAQFKADKAVLLKAKDQLVLSKNNVTSVVKDLKDAPAQDWQDLSQRYQLNSTGAANFTEMLFGAQAKQYYEMAHQAWQRVKPILDKMQKEKQATAPPPDLEGGRYIHFPEDDPQPDWLVEKARISMSLAQGDFAIEVDELTAQHWRRNNPTRLTMQSKNLLNTGSLALNASVFVEQKNAIRSEADWTVTGLALQQLPVSQSKHFNLALAKGDLQVTGEFKFADNQLDNKNQLTLSQSRFTGQSDNKAGKVMIDILSGVDNLSVDIGAKGDIQSPDFSIHSALDKIIFKALKQQLAAKLNAFKSKTQAGLQRKLAQQLQLSNSDSNELLAMDGSFDDLSKSLEKLLTTQIKGKVEDTIKDKLKDKLKGLFP